MKKDMAVPSQKFTNGGFVKRRYRKAVTRGHLDEPLSGKTIENVSHRRHAGMKFIGNA
jgi:hypothetical protein